MRSVFNVRDCGTNDKARCHALNVIDCLNEHNDQIHEFVTALAANTEISKRGDARMAIWISEKWALQTD